MNIKFSYLYRDGANYKNFNEVIFNNSNHQLLEGIERVIKENLIDGLWFKANEWGLPDLHFKEYAWNLEIDHCWHEFEFVEESHEDITEKISIEEFLLIITKHQIHIS